MKRLKCLFTGTGRCGSVYYAKLLTSLGIPCGHESVFDFDGIDAAILRLQNKLRIKSSPISGKKFENEQWIENEFKCIVNFENIEAESSYMAAPFLDHEILKETKIIHLIRNPIKVINSFVNKLNYFSVKPVKHAFFYEKYIYKTLPSIKNLETQYDKACGYYILWNELIESKIDKKNSMFHRIEDGEESVLKWIGITPTKIMFSNTKENFFPKNNVDEFSIDKIKNPKIKSKFIEICEKYKYL